MLRLDGFRFFRPAYLLCIIPSGVVQDLVGDQEVMLEVTDAPSNMVLNFNLILGHLGVVISKWPEGGGVKPPKAGKNNKLTVRKLVNIVSNSRSVPFGRTESRGKNGS